MTEAFTMSKEEKTKKATLFVIGASLLTLMLYLLPFLRPFSYPFMLLSTLVHEMGHGVMAVLVGGQFHSFEMWADGSGVAKISGAASGLPKAAVAAAGLLGPAVMALLGFLGVKSEKSARFTLASFGIILVLSIMLVVRNLFGVFFVAGLAACCFYFSLGSGKKYCQIVLAFFASQLALSVFSRSDYLFSSTAYTSAGPMPSDVAQIADALFLPYWFWGACCGLFSLAILAFGMKKIFR